MSRRVLGIYGIAGFFDCIEGAAICFDPMIPKRQKIFLLMGQLALAVLFCSIALFHGVRASYDLDWPPELDVYRDMAQAQVILDGEYPADYLIKDEWLWYNPLTAGVVALGSWGSDMPPHRVSTRMGAWFNLLVPITFFALVWYLFDAWVALVALGSFLFFVPQQRESYALAGYSPWLAAPQLAQAIFYGTLLCWAATLRVLSGGRVSWFRFGVVGAMLGFTFLAHTAPALLVGLITVISVPLMSWKNEAHRQDGHSIRLRTLGALGLLLTVAFVVSLPFSISILFRYGLEFRNLAHTQWDWEWTTWANLPTLLWSLLSWKTALVVLGFARIFWLPIRRESKMLVCLWTGSAALFLGNSYLSQWGKLHDIAVLEITPGYHYFIYLSAASHLFFGLGVVTLVNGAIALVQRMRGRRAQFSSPLSEFGRGITLTVVIVGLTVAHYRDFRVWYGFTRERTVAQKRLAQTDQFTPYTWIKAHANSRDIFLCNDRIGLLCVAPAGARVLASDPRFYNVYVPYAARDGARDTLWKALREGDNRTFMDTAKDFGVRYVLAEGEQRNWVASSGILSLEEVFTSANFAIYQVGAVPQQADHEVLPNTIDADERGENTPR